MPSNLHFGYFVIWTAALICLNNGAPTPEKSIWDSFMSSLVEKKCKFEDYVVFPKFNDADTETAESSIPETFFDLSVPLKACVNATKESAQTPLCYEIFNAVYDITTCNPEVQELSETPLLTKPVDVIVQASNLCEEFFAKRDLLASSDSVSSKLTDKLVCRMVCEENEDMLKACSFLLWARGVKSVVHGILEEAHSSKKLSGSEIVLGNNVQNKKDEAQNGKGEARDEMDDAQNLNDEEDAQNLNGEEDAHGKKDQKNSHRETVETLNSVDSAIITQKGKNSSQISSDAATANDSSLDEHAKTKLMVKKVLEGTPKPVANEKTKPSKSGVSEAKSNGDPKKTTAVSDPKSSQADSKLTTKSTTTVKNPGKFASAVSNNVSKSTKHGTNAELNTGDKSNKNKPSLTINSETSEHAVTQEQEKSPKSEGTGAVVPGDSKEEQLGKKTEDSQSVNIVPEGSKAEAPLNKPSSTVSTVVNQEAVSGNGGKGAAETASASEDNPKTNINKDVVGSDANKASGKTSGPKAETEEITESDGLSNVPVEPVDNLDGDKPPPLDESANYNEQFDRENDRAVYDDAVSLAQQEGADENVDSNEGKNNDVHENTDVGQDQSAQSHDMKTNVLPKRISDSFPEQEDTHFFFYFITIVIFAIGGYVLFHNKQKIFALIIEGRHERRRRSGASYRKLETK